MRSGNTDVAAGAFEQLSAMTRASGTELALGIEAARRALLREDAAEELYLEALERLRHTRIRVEFARAQLLYGEWLRRHGRRVDARAQLRTAHEALIAMGVEAFADRARRELAATGETLRKRTVETPGELTTQEAHIARLAEEGLTSREIAAALYLSPRTVECTSARSSPNSGSAPGGNAPAPPRRLAVTACPPQALFMPNGRCQSDRGDRRRKLIPQRILRAHWRGRAAGQGAVPGFSGTMPVFLPARRPRPVATWRCQVGTREAVSHRY